MSSLKGSMDGNRHLWWLTVLSLNCPGITFRDLSREGVNEKQGNGEGQEQKAKVQQPLRALLCSPHYLYVPGPEREKSKV